MNPRLRRCFGYTLSADQIVPHEAQHIQDAVQALVSENVTLTEIARSWNAEGVFTTAGNAWTASSVARLLRNPRLIGKRSSPAIISTHDYNMLVARHESRSRIRTSTYLLSGVLICDVCGAHMTVNGSSRFRAYHVYRCIQGCVSITLHRAEQMVSERTQEVLCHYRQQAIECGDTAEIIRRMRVIDHQMMQCAQDLSDESMSESEYSAITERLVRMRHSAERARRKSHSHMMLIGDDVPAWWKSLPLRTQANVVRSVWDAIYVSPRSPGCNGQERLHYVSGALESAALS